MLLLGVPATSAGQAAAPPLVPEAPGYTLAAAQSYALAHQPRLALSEAELEARRADARVPAARWLPRVGVTAQLVGGTNNNSAANWLGSGGAVEFPRIAGTGFLQQPSAINWTPYANTALGVSLEQRVWDFGRTAAEQAVLDARVAQAQSTESARRMDTVLSVREAWFGVLSARSVLRSAEEALARTQGHRDLAQAWVAQGLRPRVELERAEADVARYTLGRYRAAQSLRAARAALAAVLGSEAPELDAVGDASEPAPAVQGETGEALVEQLLSDLEARDPQLAALRSEVQARRAETRLLAAELLPELRIVATVMGSAGGAPADGHTEGAFGAGVLPWIPNYFVGLVFSWRIVDGVATARHRGAATREAVASAELRVAREERRRAVEQSWLEVRSAREALPVLAQVTQAAQAHYAQVEGRFRQGLATSIELADAEVLRTQAELQQSLGRYELARARARFARALSHGEEPHVGR